MMRPMCYIKAGDRINSYIVLGSDMRSVKVRCLCGKYHKFYMNDAGFVNITDCDCGINENMNIEHFKWMVGKKFGSYLVCDIIVIGSIICVKCSIGDEYVYLSPDIVLRDEIESNMYNSEKIYIGLKVDKIKILEIRRDVNYKCYIKYMCDCGNTGIMPISMVYDALKNGSNLSCGKCYSDVFSNNLYLLWRRRISKVESNLEIVKNCHEFYEWLKNCGYNKNNNYLKLKDDSAGYRLDNIEIVDKNNYSSTDGVMVNNLYRKGGTILNLENGTVALNDIIRENGLFRKRQKFSRERLKPYISKMSTYDFIAYMKGEINFSMICNQINAVENLRISDICLKYGVSKFKVYNYMINTGDSVKEAVKFIKEQENINNEYENYDDDNEN